MTITSRFFPFHKPNFVIVNILCRWTMKVSYIQIFSFFLSFQLFQCICAFFPFYVNCLPPLQLKVDCLTSNMTKPFSNHEKTMQTIKGKFIQFFLSSSVAI